MKLGRQSWPTIGTVAVSLCLGCAGSLVAGEPFAIHLVDEETDRGVPLVELRTVPNQTYLTDSQGYVAIDDPTLLGQKVFFHVTSHGYEFPKDAFGFRGVALQVEPGQQATIKIKRINIAQRLYRITGAGIYRDSVKLKKQVPIEQPLLNGRVTGQDSVQAVRLLDQVYWFWGDTNRLGYPLGQFNTSGAVSKLPSGGGLQPDLGINLRYVTDQAGFSRPMFKRENGVLIWVDGAFAMSVPGGKPRVVVHYSRRKSLAKQLSHGLAILDTEKQQLKPPLVEFDKDQSLFPRGHSFRAPENDYVYFADPYPMVRVFRLYDFVIDSAKYEAFTPLKPGSSRADPGNLDRTADGRLNFAWKKDTAPVEARQLAQWVRQGVIEEDENLFRTVDAATGKEISLHRGSIHWNAVRKRWIMIANQSGGSSSFLGEVWYTEARHPEGPFAKAVKIVTHERYSFYNPAHHDFFDQEGGRLIYFEGTYTKMFSKTKVPTPWYDYNQIMYRLDLADPRLKPAFVE